MRSVKSLGTVHNVGTYHNIFCGKRSEKSKPRNKKVGWMTILLMCFHVLTVMIALEPMLSSTKDLLMGSLKRKYDSWGFGVVQS